MIQSKRFVQISILSCLLLTVMSCGNPNEQPADKRPSILLIIIDTLRADHLSCYGYERNTSPAIDSIAHSGVMCENVYAQSSWTLPATASIMTGLTPRTHGINMNVPTGSVYGFDPATPTMAMMFNSAGYRTAGFFNVDLLSEDFGFHRGFDTYSCRENGNGMAGVTVEEAVEWLETTVLGSNDPFFLTIHLFDVHDPYDPPSPWDTFYSEDGAEGGIEWLFTPEGAVADISQCSQMTDMYDAEIAWVDDRLGYLFGKLRNMGLAESTIIVVTADHGEEFLEHGYVGHGRTFYQETVWVPLILSGPGVPEEELITSATGQYDILPTVLKLCGIEIPEGVEGYSILDGGNYSARFIPASGINTGPDFNQVSVVHGSRKIIWNVETDESETYNLNSDPTEQKPLLCDSILLEAVQYYWAAPCLWEPVLLEEWQVAPVLRDLGYIN